MLQLHNPAIFFKNGNCSRFLILFCLDGFRRYLFVFVIALGMFPISCKKQVSLLPPNESSLGKVLCIPPAGSAYTGAYLAEGEAEDELTLESIEKFERDVGKHQAIIAFSSFWGQQSFPSHNLELISRHGSLPLIYWSPWDQPYDQKKKPDQFNLHAILEGKWDAYIDMWAEAAKKIGYPFLVAWGLEMNGTWFPWSGYFYGAGNPLDSSSSGPPHAPLFSGPEIYKKSYRYVVDRVRKRGAHNILWVFHVNNYSYPADHWNALVQYYPGSDYVDWLGMSAYGAQFKDDIWVTPQDVFYYAYKDICTLDPHKPVILAEWGIADFPHQGNKAQWLTEAFQILSTQFPRIKAAVFWNERWQNEDKSFSNLRVTSSLESLEAYREGVASPFWLAYPLFDRRRY